VVTGRVVPGGQNALGLHCVRSAVENVSVGHATHLAKPARGLIKSAAHLLKLGVVCLDHGAQASRCCGLGHDLVALGDGRLGVVGFLQTCSTW
jgi:hypothetical protein